MGHSYRNYLSRFNRWLSGRIRQVPKSPIDPKRLSGLFILIVAIIIGCFAHDLSEKEAIQIWEKTHLPSPQIFGFAMGSRGYMLENQTNRLHQVNRTLPTTVDDSGSIWLSENADWVVYFPTTDPEGREKDAFLFRVYCSQCSNLPKKWSRAGIGWRGMEGTLAKLDAQIARNRLNVKTQKNASKVSRDSRELVY